MNVPVFVTVVLLVNAPKFWNDPALVKVDPTAFVNAPPKSTLKVAPEAFDTVLLFVKACGHVNVPPLLATLPLLVKGASCMNVAVLVKEPVTVFVQAEFELKLPALLTVPEFNIPPELVTLPPELTVKVP